ncbi:MAG: hypothetical protein OXG40_01790 [Acidimicrobiaceae bacterium]|nr:hypothetical protein [Acidimicrobiaceae bacterium]MDE0516902.1 hypothetical protein [Acidimicrobiaceae bacterium]MDE0657918.1 hypothetical protein [Acidimicrobiaceae bacterium]
MLNPLFRQHDLRTVLEVQRQTLANEIDSLAEDRALSTSPSDLSNYFIEKYTVDPIVIAEDDIQSDYSDAQVDVSQRIDYAVFDRSRPAMVPGTRIAFFVPFTGDEQLLQCRPSSYWLDGGIRALPKNGELVFLYDRTASDLPSVRDEFEADLGRLKKYLGQIEADVRQHNDAVKSSIDQLIEARRQKILNDRGIVANLGYPMKRRSDVSRTYATPEVKRRITPQLPSPSTEPFESEPALDMEHYEHILSVISNMVTVMEQSPQAFKEMREEDLRQHFLVQLNGHYEGRATAETFNYEGKTDILVRDGGKNIFVAECKFWNGPAAFTKAIDQILGYVSWRDTKTAILMFNRNKEMSSVLAKIPDAVRGHPNCKAKREYNTETGFRYVLGQRDDSNREVLLTVLVFNVPS